MPMPSRKLELAMTADESVVVDRENNVIRNVAVMSVGEATGHGLYLDQKSIEANTRTLQAAQSSKAGVGVLHGGDRLMKDVGKLTNIRTEGTQTRADVQIDAHAFTNPTGDLGTWLMDFAAAAPTRLGLSVVSMFDLVDREVKGLQVAEPTENFGVDFVGDPAANRLGLLSARDTPPTSPNPADTATKKDTDLMKWTSRMLAALSVIAGVDVEALTDSTKRDEVFGMLTSREQAAFKVASMEPGENVVIAAFADVKDGVKALEALGFEEVEEDDAPQDQGEGSAEAALSARKQETDRIKYIMGLSTKHELGEDWTNKMIDNPKMNRERIAEHALTALEAKEGPVPGLSSMNAKVGQEPLDVMLAVVPDAIAVAAGLSIPAENCDAKKSLELSASGKTDLKRGADGKVEFRNPHELATQLGGNGIRSVGRYFLRTLGVPNVNEGMSDKQVWDLMCNPMQLARVGSIGVRAFTHATTDFPGFYDAIIGKMLVPMYEEVGSSYESFVTSRIVPDFKKVTFNSMSPFSRLRRISEGQDYSEGTFAEGTDEARVYKWGQLASFTWEAFQNDDMGFIADAMISFAETARMEENEQFWLALLSNPIIGETGQPLFNAGVHANLNTGGAAALSRASLSQMRQSMALQRTAAPQHTSVDAEPGRHMSIVPNKLVVPEALAVEADLLTSSPTQLGQNNAALPNDSYIRNLRVISEPRLDTGVYDPSTQAFSGASQTQYFLAQTGRASCPTAYILRMRGHEAPFTERVDTGVTADKMTTKLRHVFGFKMTQYRCWAKNDGV